MPNELTDLDLDEVSLVGKAANGKRFLIFKSLEKSIKGDKMKMTKPARAAKTGAGASVTSAVTKADILAIVQKAVEPIQKENKRLRDIIQKKDFEEIAKSDFGELGDHTEIAAVLKSMEGLPSEARKPIIKALKQANAMKKEAGAMLYKSVGSSRPAPGTGRAEFAALVEKKLAEVRKSNSKISDPMILKALAIDEVSKEYPDLAMKVNSEQKQDAIKRQIGVA